jgi:hypothetical protein
MYRYQFGGQQIALTKGLLFFVLVSVFALWWLEYLMPLPLLPLLLLYFGFVVIKNPLARRQATVKSEALLAELAAMQKQLNAANTRVRELVVEIETSQVELDQTRSVKKSLAAEIESKLAEVENWRKLSDEQKKTLHRYSWGGITEENSIRDSRSHYWFHCPKSSGDSHMGTPWRSWARGITRMVCSVD